MKKRIVSFVLAVLMLIMVMPYYHVTSYAVDTPQYKKAILRIDLSKIRSVGCQNGGQACACFALAYCTTILDNKIHYYSEYNIGTNQNNAICDWSRGSFNNDYFPTNKADAYEMMYSQITSGNPVVVKVAGKRSSHHYVAVVGVENVTTYESLSANNFLILDPAVSVFDIENMKSVGYDLKIEDNKYQVVRNGTGKTATITSIEYTCNHSYNNVGVCTSTCKKEFDFQSTYKMDDAGIYTVNISNGIYLRPDKPYAAAEASTTKIKYGTEVEVLGSVTNAFDNKWYKVSYKGEIGYTSADNLTFKRYDAQRITGSITSPMEGSQVPKAAYSVPISGTITSKYPLKEIKAYVDGHCFVTVPLGNTLTYDLKNSLVEQVFDLSSLSLGYHTLTLEAKDIFHNEYTEVCSRSFVTVSADAGKVQAICCDMTSPTEGAQVPKEAYSVPIAGTITSNYPLKEIKAYVDGHCFVTVPLGSVTTYELEGSLIEQLFDLSSLNLGPHTLTLEARDIYHDEFVEICSRGFTTVMPGAICEHSYYEISRVEPTCVQYGYVTYGCFYCDYSYQQELVPTNEHTHVIDIRMEPDCDTAGYEYYVCSVCGGDPYTIELPAKGHEIWSFYEEATCNTPEQWLYVCNLCGYTYTEEISPPLGHDYLETYVEPTCDTAGYIVYTCQSCGYEYEEIVTTPAHKYEVTVVSPTCTTDGFTVHRCIYCQDYYITDSIALLGHYFAYNGILQPTETETGILYRECIRCAEAGNVELPILNTEDYEYTVVREPTAEADGIGYYVWKNKSYGTVRFMVTIPMLTDRYWDIPILVQPEYIDCTSLRFEIGYDPSSVYIVDISGDIEFGTDECIGKVIVTVENTEHLNKYREGDVLFVVKVNTPGSIESIDEVRVQIEAIHDMGNVVIGDVNGDGTINGKDSNVMKQYISGSIQNIAFENADLFEDGQIDAKDANILLGLIAGN